MNNLRWLSRTVLGVVFASVALVSPLLAQGITPPPKPEPQAPAVERNLRTFDVLDFDVFSNQKWDRLSESHARDIVVTWPDGRETRGIERHIEDLKALFVFAPDIEIKTHPIRFGSGSWTAVTGVMTGTFSRPMPTPDGGTIAPTGRWFALSMVTIGHWVNGVMDHEWLFWDNQEFMRQIGLAPAASGLSLDVYTADTGGFGVTSTLIAGPTEAILVDAQFRISDARKVADRVAATGRRLKAIVITHAHPDHYFGIGTLLDRFPGTPVYMTTGALAEFEQQVRSKIAQWSPVFGSEIPTAVPTPQLLPPGNLTVDGIVVEVLRDLQGDAATPTNSAVWIPSLRALIASDLVYEDVHVWLAESTVETRRAWQAALGRLQDLGPAVVVSGHKKTADLPDAPSAVDFTVRYIAEFEAARGAARSAEELVTTMKGKYPQAGLPIILDFAARAAIPN